MLGFCIVAPVGDAIAKLLGTRVDLGEVLLFRFAIQSLVLIPLVAVTGRAWRMSGRVLWLAALRTGLLILGISTMFTALKFVPLADAVAIAFVMPFIMLL
ncbi:MAG: DMT family transporter, partial [Marinibacterium sp.]